MSANGLDPVTQEILASGFHHIAEEMAVVEYRSSYSPIIREMLDFNCGLFDAQTAAWSRTPSRSRPSSASCSSRWRR